MIKLSAIRDLVRPRGRETQNDEEAKGCQRTCTQCKSQSKCDAPLTTTKFRQTLFPHTSKAHFDFQSLGDVLPLRWLQLRVITRQKFRKDVSEIAVDLFPSGLERVLFVPVQFFDRLLDLALVFQDG